MTPPSDFLFKRLLAAVKTKRKVKGVCSGLYPQAGWIEEPETRGQKGDVGISWKPRKRVLPGGTPNVRKTF